MPSTASKPTAAGSPGEASWSLPQPMSPLQEELEESEGASCAKPSGLVIISAASGLFESSWKTCAEEPEEGVDELPGGGGSPSGTCAPMLPSSPCQARMKSWLRVVS